MACNHLLREFDRRCLPRLFPHTVQLAFPRQAVWTGCRFRKEPSPRCWRIRGGRMRKSDLSGADCPQFYQAKRCLAIPKQPSPHCIHGLRKEMNCMRASLGVREELAARVQQALALPSKKEAEMVVDTVVVALETTLLNNLQTDGFTLKLGSFGKFSVRHKADSQEDSVHGRDHNCRRPVRRPRARRSRSLRLRHSRSCVPSCRTSCTSLWCSSCRQLRFGLRRCCRFAGLTSFGRSGKLGR